MAKGQAPRPYRSTEELERAVRVLCEHFDAQAVVIIGSQAILGHWPEAPLAMRLSLEIYAYLADYAEWQARHPGQEASEEINALFGYGSDFHRQFGFYIDGVDAATAMLAPDWPTRQKVVPIAGRDREVFAIVPGIDDLVVSKLCRLDPKDRDWIAACHGAAPLNIEEIKRLFGRVAIGPEIRERGENFLDRLIAATRPIGEGRGDIAQ